MDKSDICLSQKIAALPGNIATVEAGALNKRGSINMWLKLTIMVSRGSKIITWAVWQEE